MKMGAVQGQYGQFNSAATIIGTLQYNTAVYEYQKDVGGFPASVLGALSGVKEVEPSHEKLCKTHQRTGAGRGGQRGGAVPGGLCAQLPSLPKDQCVVDGAGVLSSSTVQTITELNAQLESSCSGAQIRCTDSRIHG